MIIGYSYLYKHNPNIDWQKGQWKFIRCLDTCASKACKIRDVEVEANELYLKLDVSRSLSLDNIGDEDLSNHILSWADTTDPDSHQQTMMIAAILNNQDQYNIETQIAKTQRPGRLMCQSGYTSMGMCFRRISQRECQYRNCIIIRLTL